MKLHGDDEGRAKKLAVTAGLVAVLVVTEGSVHAADTTSSQDVQIEAVDPAVFGSGASILIKGSGFLSEDTVFLGALKLEVAELKSTSIRAAVPEKAKTGPSLTVRRGKKKVATFSKFTFAKAPAAKKTLPTFGVTGIPMKLLGANLDTVTQLKVGETVIKIDSVQKNALTFVVPKGLVTGTLTVSGPGGAATMKKPFEVFYPPVIEKVDPAAAFPGDEVTVTGQHFDTKGIRFYIGTKSLKPKEVTAKKAVFSIPVNARSGAVKATARKISAESSSPLTVYPVPKLTSSPSMVASPGALKLRGKNLDVVETWSIGGQKLGVDTTAAKSSASAVQLKIPEDTNLGGAVTATYKGREFTAKKSTTIAATPYIGAVRFAKDAAGAGCEYTVVGKNFSDSTAFKLGTKKAKLVSAKDTEAVLSTGGACASKNKQVSAKNGRFAGNTYAFNPDAEGYTATPEEAAARLTAGNTDYTQTQILSDLALMNSRFAGSSATWVALGKEAGNSAEQRNKVDQVSMDIGNDLIRLALAEEALCTAMTPGREAAAANTSAGAVLDQVVKKEKHLMNDVLIPLWSELPKSSMSKGVQLNTVDTKVTLIDTVSTKRKTCANRYYGKKPVAEAEKVAAVNLAALHEQALLGAVSNLSGKDKNTVVVEKALDDALYSFDSTRRAYWVKKAKTASASVQKSSTKTVGKGAGKNKQVEKSNKEKPKSNTGKGKGK